jgi:hypothetical protein
LDGLSPGKYGVFLHDYGDISEGWSWICSL